MFVVLLTTILGTLIVGTILFLGWHSLWALGLPAYVGVMIYLMES
jgi:hypothetical protein